MKKRLTLIAENGHIITNGTDYAEILTLPVGESDYGFYEITDEEYLEIMKGKEKAALGEGGLE